MFRRFAGQPLKHPLSQASPAGPQARPGPSWSIGWPIVCWARPQFHSPCFFCTGGGGPHPPDCPPPHLYRVLLNNSASPGGGGAV